jgi:short-subunit dehydrogenase
MRKTLIIGATSAIAQATARRLAKAGDELFLVARDADKLNVLANDMRVRGATAVQTETLDVLEYDRHEAVLDKAVATLGTVDLALIAHGTLPDQSECARSMTATREAFEINAFSVIALLTRLANIMETQGTGTIAVISSVAGDRGRQSNYVYGASKGAVTVFLQGLRNRLSAANVHVMTVKPGFVDTPMTKEFEKGVLWASADDVARIIEQNLARDVVYAPWFWRWIMLIIRAIPERLFKRLKL